MEDLNKILQLSETYPLQLEEMTEDFLLKLRVILWGQAAIVANKEKARALAAASPHQTKKRVKRLSSLNEVNEVEDNLDIEADDKNDKKASPPKSRRSNADLLDTAESLKETNDAIEFQAPVAAPRTQSTTPASINIENLENADEDIRKSEATSLMPPPPAPVVAITDEMVKRPQRSARLKCEKNLREPTLKGKIRRPTEEVKIKLEHEQRASQLHESSVKSLTAKSSTLAQSNESGIKTSLSSTKSDDSICVIPGKKISTISINSDVDDVPTNKPTDKEGKNNGNIAENGVREIRIKIKREKNSLEKAVDSPDTTSDDLVFKAPTALPPPMTLVKNETASVGEITLTNSILSSTANTTTSAPAKKTRSKKEPHKPIKVERFSDLDRKILPISTRTRHGKASKIDDTETSPIEENKRPPSIYEDAVETPPSRNSKEISSTTEACGIINQSVNIAKPADATMNLGPAPGDATFCTNPAQTTFQGTAMQTTFVMDSNPNATVTLKKDSKSAALADATFDVQQVSKTDKNKDDVGGHRSFETARDSSIPNNDSLLTEDEQEKPEDTEPKAPTVHTKAKGATKTSATTKAAYKMPTRTNELFNPLAQSPVKLRVEAFENAAAAATEQSKRTLRNKKENITPSSTTTPIIGKLGAPALGRFLTPTQGSNVPPINSAIAKKATTSASKALPVSKAVSALQRSNSAVSNKTLHRENSADDFRKGLHSLAEERRKQREQKHLLAAQLREAKERERAERMAKLAKEREDKRLMKKQQEQEQKRRELEEIQRKLRQQQEDEAAKVKAAKEREILSQMKQQQQLAKQKMMPPPPKTTLKYTFEMLHEDDSTDDEDKVSYKRPPPPSWSRRHARGPAMLKQEYTPAAYIDSFFSVQPMTPDLKIIFPNIDARHLKRNSSVLWSTPPRYSELPKY